MVVCLFVLFACNNIYSQEKNTIQFRNTANGIIRPDYTFNFVIPENPVFVYDTTGYLIVYDYSTTPPTE
ncbi:MAG: hypothetical protein LBK94_13095, partial [Prevotellaceae bacterium]|nr:hypothetical protein [Prevotellaceae bacterium]